MRNKAAFPGQYIQGQGVLSDLPALIENFGKKALLLVSASGRNILQSHRGTPIESDNIIIELFNGECCEDELGRLLDFIKATACDVMVGMGGGKCIDTAKIVADRAHIPVIVVPTIASTDAPCSGCAVVYSNEGEFETVKYQKQNPAVVLVDLQLIATSPTRLFVAGMGDALSTWFEARSCDRTQSMNECGGISTLTGLHLAKLCYDTLLDYGLLAKIACDNGLVTPALSKITEANILLSGIGFESSGLATAHAVHNGLTALAETHAFYHGEKVAFGVLTGLHLNGSDPDEIETVYSFCEQVGLPTTLAEIGLDRNNRDYLMIAAAKACEPEQSIHHEAGEIHPKNVLEAMLMADAIGNLRKS